MSFLWEKQSRRFFCGILIFSVLLLGFGTAFCLWQAQAAKEMLLSHDGTVIGSLLKRGVPGETIAAALSDAREDSGGQKLLESLGYTAKTSARFLPAVAGFTSDSFRLSLAGMLILAGALLLFCRGFLNRRERLYLQAEKGVRAFSEGDFSGHLPRSGEGTLYRLFASVDSLASALQAKGETEYKAKEFLKDTISDISHQLKTPLAALGMYNEIILSEPDNPGTVTMFSQKTAAALDRMEQLISSLLKITRLDAGSIRFDKKPHRVAEVAARAVEQLTTRAELENKQLTVSGPPGELLVCDLQWTGEAVGNLVKNALDHTASGGHVRVSWESSPAMVRVSVSDDGDGIAPEDLHHIFKRFYRSRNSWDTQGAGLGLALARSIVEGQGGTLSVRSAPHRGAAFTLSFLTEP